ncbi:hypothetical protein ACF1DY_25915 [Streptomyces albus]
MSDETIRECGHWDGTARRLCRDVDGVRLYATGLRCPRHTPAALNHRPEPQPGPGWPAHRKEAA